MRPLLFVPDTHTLRCLVCDPHGYRMSGGPHGMSQRCGCCNGYGWHQPGDGSYCDQKEQTNG